MFEHKSEPLLHRRAFLGRLALSAVLGISIVAVSLFTGMIGYHTLEGLSWIDSFLNASMLLGGMGPVKTDLSEPGKIFAGLYALYSGLIVIALAGLLLAPGVHHLMHQVHWDEKE